MNTAPAVYREMTFYRSVFTLGELPDTELPEICISGRSNVGKSSLLNVLANRKRKKIARTSGKPGKTRSINFYRVGDLFYLVDLPGYGYAKVPKTERELFGNLVNPYLNGRRQLAGIIQLLDSRHGPVSGDHSMLDWIRGWDGNVLYVFTKADKLTAREKTILTNRIETGAIPGIARIGMENSVLFSALTNKGAESIWSWIEQVIGLDTKK